MRDTEPIASKRDGASSSKQLEGCLRERERRKSFKELVATLVSLVPPERLHGKASISEHFEEAANYVKTLEERVSELKTQIDARNTNGKLNTFEVRDLGPSFEVTLNAGKRQIADRFMHVIHSKKTSTVDSAAMESLKEALRSLLEDQTSGL